MLSNTYNRYLWLLNTLLIYKRLTFAEINEKWQHSYLNEGKAFALRTFHEHCDAVETMFHVSIKCDSAAPYRYYIDNAASLEDDKVRKWLINSFNVKEIINEGRQFRERILLEDIPEGAEYLSLVIGAMKDNRVLKVTYQSYHNQSENCYHVEPYCLKVFHQRWYVLGRFQELDGLRQISLDRVQAMEETSQSFIYPDVFSPEEYYKHVIGIWTNESFKPVNVVIRAYGLQPKYLRSLPLHESQQEINTTEHYADFCYHLCVTNDLIHELLAKGSAVEVLEPEILKKQVIKSAWGIINRYKATL